MFRTTLFIIFILIYSLSFAEGVKCNSGGNQLEMNACAGDDLTKADKELNQVLLALIHKFVSKLWLAQKAWITFRDAELDAMFACADANARICWGSMYTMSYTYSKAKLTRERTKQLEDIIQNGHGE